MRSGLSECAGSGVLFRFTLRDFVADFLSGVPKAFGYECGANVRSFGELADFAFPAANEDRTAPGAGGGFEIGDAVANHVAIFEVDAHVGCGLPEHRNAGFAAVAFLAELADFCVWVMQAIIDVVDVAAGFADGGENCALEEFERFALEVSFGDAWLIRDDGDIEAEVIEEADCFGDAREKLELRTREWSVDDACVVVIDEGVDDAIAIEEYGFHGSFGDDGSVCDGADVEIFRRPLEPQDDRYNSMPWGAGVLRPYMRMKNFCD